MKVNLGCGFRPKPGYFNCDNNDRAITDKDGKFDFHEGLPWADDSIEEIMMHNVMDTMTHPQMTQLFREIWRVLEPGGRFTFEQIDISKAPYISSWPYFIQGYTSNFFKYFSIGEDAYEGWKHQWRLPGFRETEITTNERGIMIGSMRKPKNGQGKPM